MKIRVLEKFTGLPFSFKVAFRYLFSKKSHNTVNIISSISSGGVAVATMALICVLSVFNGFDSLITKTFSDFDPDLKIQKVQGKTFNVNDERIHHLRKIKSVSVFCEVIEENAILKFKDKKMPATVKGVTDNFDQIAEMKKLIYDGTFKLYDGAFYRVVAGIGVASVMQFGAYFVDPLEIYAPKRTEKIDPLHPESSYISVPTFVTGIFNTKQGEIDNQKVIVSIDCARHLFEYDANTVSSIELKLTKNTNLEKAEKEIQNILGDEFAVKNKYEQQENFFNIMKIEKWITYLILCFILLIATFNIIGSLSMLIIDKRWDIVSLRNLGANDTTIKRIFLLEGWLISFIGAIVGIVLGVILCLIQQYFGILKMGVSADNYIVDAYPVLFKATDIVLVFITVMIAGFFSAYYPTRYIRYKQNIWE